MHYRLFAWQDGEEEVIYVAYLTPRNLAKAYRETVGASERDIRKWMDRDSMSLPWIRMGGTRKVSTDDFERFIEREKVWR